MSKRLFLSVLMTLATTGALFASPPEVLSMHGRLLRCHGGGQCFQVTVTALADHLTRGTMEVASSGDAANVAGGAIDVKLNTDEPKRFVFDVAPSTGDLGEITFRYGPEENAPIAAGSIYVAYNFGSLTEIPAADYRSRLAKKLERTRIAEAEASAVRLAAEAAAGGKQPVPIDGASLNIEEEAWNRAAAKYARRNGGNVRAETCGVFAPSSNNYTYPLYGYIAYESGYNGQIIYLRQPGYPVSVETRVEYTDGCGSYQYQTQSQSAITGANGSFIMQSVTSFDPPTSIPVTGVQVSAPDVGVMTVLQLTPPQRYLVNYGGTTETLRPGPESYSWNGYNGTVYPVIRTSNSVYPFFFPWNDEIKRIRTQWANSGFSYRFNAGYDVNAVSNSEHTADAQFVETNLNGVDDALVVFGDISKWSSRWVMAHELGHELQFRLQGGNTLGSGVEHTICALLPAQNAFQEGFADWHASFWETEGRPYNCTVGECGPACSYGYRHQGNVHAFFWDMFDWANDSSRDYSLDNVQYPLSTLHNWRSTGYSGFEDFFNDFTNRGIWGANQYTMEQLRRINMLVYPY